MPKPMTQRQMSREWKMTPANISYACRDDDICGLTNPNNPRSEVLHDARLVAKRLMPIVENHIMQAQAELDRYMWQKETLKKTMKENE